MYAVHEDCCCSSFVHFCTYGGNILNAHAHVLWQDRAQDIYMLTYHGEHYPFNEAWKNQVTALYINWHIYVVYIFVYRSITQNPRVYKTKT